MLHQFSIIVIRIHSAAVKELISLNGECHNSAEKSRIFHFIHQDVQDNLRVVNNWSYQPLWPLNGLVNPYRHSESEMRNQPKNNSG